MTNTTVDSLLALLEKSKLLDSRQLADVRREAEDSVDPAELAKSLVRQSLLTRWQAAQLLAGRSSFFLGKYKLIDLLGRGGMGSVFLGEHTTMNRRVALKIISKEVGKDPASLQRFLDEARAIAGLDHPNIVQAYSVDNEGDRYYIVMEYVEGLDLQRLVEQEGPLDCALAVDYIRQAADGLAHAHQRNMIHCDVKPSNLLVNEQGVVKILDLGLARLADRRSRATSEKDEGILGSVDYLAPEQALDSSDFDHRADIYSLGCTFYFLLTGHPPFPEGLLHERLMKHQTQQPPSILKDRADAPVELVSLCERMMAKNPADRPQSAEEISAALADWRPETPRVKRIPPLKVAQPIEEPAAEGLPAFQFDAGVKPEVSTKQTGFFRTRRHRIVAAAGGSLLVAVVLLAVAIAGLLSGPSPQAGDTPSRPTGSSRDARNAARPPKTVQHTTARPVAQNDRPPTEAESPAPDARQPGEMPAEEPAEQPATSLAAETPPDEPKTAVAPAEEPAKGPEKEPEKEPRHEKPDEANPDKPKPDEVKPNEPKPPAEKPKPRDPFAGLARAVDLPLLKPADAAAAQAVSVSLGKLDVEAGRPVDVELLGGKDAIKGARGFTLARAEGDAGWMVRLASTAKSGAAAEQSDIARIRLDGQSLDLQFVAGVDPDRANYLRNCVLRIRVDGVPRCLPLSVAKPIDPLVLNFETGIARVSLPNDWLPETSTLRMQVTKLEGDFPKPSFEPGDTAPFKGTVTVVLAGEKLPTVKLPVVFDAKGRTIRVEATATYLLADAASRPLRAKDAARVMAELVVQQQRLPIVIKAVEQDKLRKEVAEKQLEAVKLAVEQLLGLNSLCQKIQNTGKIHFRVFAAVDDQQVDLFDSQLPASTPERAADVRPNR